jgi:hypothetical protein
LGEKMDIHELAREIARQELNEKQLSSIHLIVFRKNPERGKTDPIGKHPVTEGVVFPDKKRLGSRIKEGEAWFCELDEFNPVGSRAAVYYANPIQRLDAGFLFDLRAEHISTIIEALRKSAGPQLMEQAQAQVRKELEQATKASVDALRGERDSARAELEQAQSALQKAEETIGSLRLQVAALGRSSPQSQVGPALKSSDTRRPAPLPADWQDLGDMSVIRVVRPEANRLESSWFRSGNYSVFVSPDRRLLLIRETEDEGIPAVNQQLTVPNLAVLRPFDGEEELTARLNQRRGGIVVNIAR